MACPETQVVPGQAARSALVALAAAKDCRVLCFSRFPFLYDLFGDKSQLVFASVCLHIFLVFILSLPV